MSSLRLGHVRGVAHTLAQLEQAQPASAALVAQARDMLRDYQLDALERWVTQLPPAASEHPHGLDTNE
jgi:hypothetical protein